MNTFFKKVDINQKKNVEGVFLPLCDTPSKKEIDKMLKKVMKHAKKGNFQEENKSHERKILKKAHRHKDKKEKSYLLHSGNIHDL